jgi:hypothetical protein
MKANRHYQRRLSIADKERSVPSVFKRVFYFGRLKTRTTTTTKGLKKERMQSVAVTKEGNCIKRHKEL